MFRERLDLDGRSIVLSGAGGGGIGTAACHAFADAGADIVGIDLSEEALAPSRERVEAAGRRFIPLIADATSEDAVEKAIQEARSQGGPIHGLLNVVGGALRPTWRRLEDCPAEVWDGQIAMNLRSAFLVSRSVARCMIADGTGGSIVCLASISGRASSPYHAAYGAAKAALCQLVQTMAVEWGPHGIRANVIAPGTIMTPRGGFDDDPERDRRALPLGRRGRADEIAAAALFLISELSSYITGQTLVVDGGATTKLATIGVDEVPIFMPRSAIAAQIGLDPEPTPGQSPGTTR